MLSGLFWRCRVEYASLDLGNAKVGVKVNVLDAGREAVGVGRGDGSLVVDVIDSGLSLLWSELRRKGKEGLGERQRGMSQSAASCRSHFKSRAA